MKLYSTISVQYVTFISHRLIFEKFGSTKKFIQKMHYNLEKVKITAEKSG
jgi:hypothetical protein